MQRKFWTYWITWLSLDHPNTIADFYKVRLQANALSSRPLCFSPSIGDSRRKWDAKGRGKMRWGPHHLLFGWDQLLLPRPFSPRFRWHPPQLIHEGSWCTEFIVAHLTDQGNIEIMVLGILPNLSGFANSAGQHGNNPDWPEDCWYLVPHTSKVSFCTYLHCSEIKDFHFAPYSHISVYLRPICICFCLLFVDM